MEKEKPSISAGFEYWRSILQTLSFLEKCLHKSSYLVWKLHKSLATFFYKKALWKISRDTEFAKNDIKQGVLSSADLDLLRDCVNRSPAMEKDPKDYLPGYYFDKDGGVLTEEFKIQFRFFDLRGEEEHLQKILSSIAREITSCFGHPFRIANLVCHEISPTSADFGSNVWHTDGFPPGIYKVLIYLNPAHKNSGSTEIKFPDGSSKIIEGPSGTWFLFNPNLFHRGLPAPNVGRVIIMVTLVPSLKENLHPIFAGVSANFPFFPWNVPDSNL
jgi:hypothetical protein